ncbi:MAG: YihA family ribosome biogenesis GTP-binding protein [Bacteroidales bacterium]|nr:YihA family ribosome biogenesis GTP-binding protein [Bacteroidales bacterium]
MIIRSARYISSSITPDRLPSSHLPEIAFIGRSNVGKSSLINMLTGFGKLAKTSGDPGKTRTINHFLINDNWYLVDLPGYGYAKVSAMQRQEWMKITLDYILSRENLMCLFVLIDPRHKPQKSDTGFMEFLGINRIPFARVFTKEDKMSRTNLKRSIEEYNNQMLEKWEELPVTFITSKITKSGRTEILDFIKESLNNFSKSDSVWK